MDQKPWTGRKNNTTNKHETSIAATIGVSFFYMEFER